MSADRRLRIGSGLTTLTGAFVFSVGTWFFVQFLLSVANPSQPWRSAEFGLAPYSLDEIEACDETLGKDFVLAQHIEFANVMNTGFVVAVVAWFGLRRKHRWAFWTLLVTFLWVGINDAFALLRADQPLIPLIPEILGLTGLLIARPAVFERG